MLNNLAITRNLLCYTLRVSNKSHCVFKRASWGGREYLPASSAKAKSKWSKKRFRFARIDFEHYEFMTMFPAHLSPGNNLIFITALPYTSGVICLLVEGKFGKLMRNFLHFHKTSQSSKLYPGYPSAKIYSAKLHIEQKCMLGVCSPTRMKINGKP